jgi:hypothetical protein
VAGLAGRGGGGSSPRGRRCAAPWCSSMALLGGGAVRCLSEQGRAEARGGAGDQVRGEREEPLGEANFILAFS